MESILSGAGGGNYREKLQNWIYNQENEFQKGVSAALTNKYRVPGKYIDVSHAIRDAQTIYDPADTYGPEKHQPVRKNQLEEANFNTSHAAAAIATPTPPALLLLVQLPLPLRPQVIDRLLRVKVVMINRFGCGAWNITKVSKMFGSRIATEKFGTGTTTEKFTRQ